MKATKKDEPVYLISNSWEGTIATGLTKREYIATQCLGYLVRADSDFAVGQAIKLADLLISKLNETSND